jgi:hypothetical protein
MANIAARPSQNFRLTSDGAVFDDCYEKFRAAVLPGDGFAKPGRRAYIASFVDVSRTALGEGSRWRLFRYHYLLGLRVPNKEVAMELSAIRREVGRALKEAGLFSP